MDGDDGIGQGIREGPYFFLGISLHKYLKNVFEVFHNFPLVFLLLTKIEWVSSGIRDGDNGDGEEIQYF